MILTERWRGSRRTGHRVQKLIHFDFASTRSAILGSMYITKCDICKKTIKDYQDGVVVGYRTLMARHSFCIRCAKPVEDFLKEHKLVANDKRKMN